MLLTVPRKLRGKNEKLREIYGNIALKVTKLTSKLCALGAVVAYRFRRNFLYVKYIINQKLVVSQ